MCDGVTQGQRGMELSLFSRDTIALSTAIALSHGMFEAAALLGICDKIVPGLLIGALRFGHLPTILVPAGPMPSGLANKEKQRVRQLYAEGKVGRAELLEAESRVLSCAGTCTFYGTANSNQMMMEVMGLHIPGAAFVNPGTKLRQELTRAAVHRLAEIGWDGNDYRPLGRCVDEKAIVNAAVGLLATGGSTNHAIHLPAIARAAGIMIDWEDFDRLSARRAADRARLSERFGRREPFPGGGRHGFVDRDTARRRAAPSRHPDGRRRRPRATMRSEPKLDGETLVWEDAPAARATRRCCARPSTPFQPDGGMRLVQGNLGRATFKTSAVDRDALDDRGAGPRLLRSGRRAGRVQGRRARSRRGRGRPLPGPARQRHARAAQADARRSACCRIAGFKVALVTDGRMSGASGKVPAAIHRQPRGAGRRAARQAARRRRRPLCADRGELTALVDDAEWDARERCGRAAAAVRHRARAVRLFMRMAPMGRSTAHRRCSAAAGSVDGTRRGRYRRNPCALRHRRGRERPRHRARRDRSRSKTAEHASLQTAWEAFGASARARPAARRGHRRRLPGRRARC